MKNLKILLFSSAFTFCGCSVEHSVFGKIGQDNPTYQKGYREGYQQGQADAAKREYWVVNNRNGWEQNPRKHDVTYYTFETETTTPDGRKLEPRSVTVPIVGRGE